MPVFSVIIATAATSVQGAIKKNLNAKCRNCEFTVSAMITFFALVFFLIFSNGIDFSVAFLPYCAVYSVCYACAAVTYVLALSCGSLALTQLILSYSCIIPLTYSLICGARFGLFPIFGVFFLFFSLVVTYYRKSKPGESKGFSLKWVIYIVLMFLSNGFCGVVTRMQQLRFGGVYDRSFMVFSLMMATLLLVCAATIREGRYMLKTVQQGALLSAACGASNGLANYFGLLCLAMIPNTVYYPIKSAAELVLTAAMSVFLFKEKLRTAQYIGVGLGTVALICINIS